METQRRFSPQWCSLVCRSLGSFPEAKRENKPTGVALKERVGARFCSGLLPRPQMRIDLSVRRDYRALIHWIGVEAALGLEPADDRFATSTSLQGRDTRHPKQFY